MTKCYNSKNYYNFDYVYNYRVSFSPASYQPKEILKTLYDTLYYWKDTFGCFIDHKVGREVDSVFIDPKAYYNYTYVKENYDYSVGAGAAFAIGDVAALSNLFSSAASIDKYTGGSFSRGREIADKVWSLTADTIVPPIPKDLQIQLTLFPFSTLYLILSSGIVDCMHIYDSTKYAFDIFRGRVEELQIIDPTTDWI